MQSDFIVPALPQQADFLDVVVVVVVVAAVVVVVVVGAFVAVVVVVVTVVFLDVVVAFEVVVVVDLAVVVVCFAVVDFVSAVVVVVEVVFSALFSVVVVSTLVVVASVVVCSVVVVSEESSDSKDGVGVVGVDVGAFRFSVVPDEQQHAVLIIKTVTTNTIINLPKIESLRIFFASFVCILHPTHIICKCMKSPYDTLAFIFCF